MYTPNLIPHSSLSPHLRSGSLPVSQVHPHSVLFVMKAVYPMWQRLSNKLVSIDPCAIASECRINTLSRISFSIQPSKHPPPCTKILTASRHPNPSLIPSSTLQTPAIVPFAIKSVFARGQSSRFPYADTLPPPPYPTPLSHPGESPSPTTH